MRPISDTERDLFTLEVDRLLKKYYGITLNDAGITIPLNPAPGETPRTWVIWFAEHYDLQERNA